MFLTLIIGIFIFAELVSILTLYFKANFPYATGTHTFRLCDNLPDDRMQDLLQYFTYWIAGSKLVVLSLLLIIAIFADEQIQFYTVTALTLLTAVVYWKIYPLLRSMDKEGLIRPFGYSKTIGRMIAGLLLTFGVVVTIYLIS